MRSSKDSLDGRFDLENELSPFDLRSAPLRDGGRRCWGCKLWPAHVNRPVYDQNQIKSTHNDSSFLCGSWWSVPLCFCLPPFSLSRRRKRIRGGALAVSRLCVAVCGHQRSSSLPPHNTFIQFFFSPLIGKAFPKGSFSAHKNSKCSMFSDSVLLTAILIWKRVWQQNGWRANTRTVQAVIRKN